MIIGCALVVIGAVIYFFGNKLDWIGRLPGDIRIEKGNFKFFLPITTMILLSLLISLVVRIIRNL
jgi:Protein of unknown function (DUF2905)